MVDIVYLQTFRQCTFMTALRASCKACIHIILYVHICIAEYVQHYVSV